MDLFLFLLCFVDILVGEALLLRIGSETPSPDHLEGKKKAVAFLITAANYLS